MYIINVHIAEVHMELGKTGQKGEEARATARRQVKEGPAPRAGQLADDQQREKALKSAHNSARGGLNEKKIIQSSTES